MIRNEDKCFNCKLKIKNELVLVPNGLSTGYLIFDSLDCLKACAMKYDLASMAYCSNVEVDKLIAEVKKKPKWSIKTYGINVVYELIDRKKI